MIVLVVVVGVGAAIPRTTLAQEFTWKTYLDPIYNYTIEYPDRHDTFFMTNPYRGSIYINSNQYSDHFWEISLNVAHFNTTKFTDLKSVADDLYHRSTVEFGAKSLYEVNGSELTNYPTYTYSIYQDEGEDATGEFRVSKMAFQLHDGNVFLFSLSDLNSDTHFDEFDRFVNSIKFFD